MQKRKGCEARKKVLCAREMKLKKWHGNCWPERRPDKASGNSAKKVFFFFFFHYQT